MLGMSPSATTNNGEGFRMNLPLSSMTTGDVPFPAQPQRTMMGWLYTGTTLDDGGSGPYAIWGRSLSFIAHVDDGHLELSGEYVTTDVLGPTSQYTVIALVDIESATSYFGLGERIFIASTSSGTDRGALFSSVTTAGADYHLYFGDATRPASEVTYATFVRGKISQDVNDDQRFIGTVADGLGYAWGPQTIVPRALSLGEIRDFQFSPRALPGCFLYYDPNAQGQSAQFATLPERSGKGIPSSMSVANADPIPFVTSPEPGYHRIPSGVCG